MQCQSGASKLVAISSSSVVVAAIAWQLKDQLAKPASAVAFVAEEGPYRQAPVGPELAAVAEQHSCHRGFHPVSDSVCFRHGCCCTCSFGLHLGADTFGLDGCRGAVGHHLCCSCRGDLLGYRPFSSFDH